MVSLFDHWVIQARKEGREIIYTLENGHGLQGGQRVKMTIDWERRYSLMRLHFEAEVILELVYQNLKGIEKIGAISPRISRESTSSGMRIFPGTYRPWRKKRLE
jgi:Ser-tRNA(Ala) deacylase AlaX